LAAPIIGSGRRLEHESDAAVFGGFQASAARQIEIRQHFDAIARVEIETHAPDSEEIRRRAKRPDLKIRKIT
jgi:hypothetical protein